MDQSDHLRGQGGRRIQFTHRPDLARRHGCGVESEFGLALSNDRIFVKPTKSTVTAGMAIPQMAYLPSFAGIQPREERLSPAMQRRLIGRGLAGEALRNILYDLFQAHGKKKESLRRSNGELDRAAWQSRLRPTHGGTCWKPCKSASKQA